MTLQPSQGHDLHGSAPDTYHTALLLIDVINDFEFPRGASAVFSLGTGLSMLFSLLVERYEDQSVALRKIRIPSAFFSLPKTAQRFSTPYNNCGKSGQSNEPGRKLNGGRAAVSTETNHDGKGS